jgi:ATP adenylyltransferase
MTLEQLWAGWRLEYIEAASDDERARRDACVFCTIFSSGVDDEDANVVWRDPEAGVVALLNAYPYASGHLLVMPVRHLASLEDLESAECDALWAAVTSAVVALRRAYDPDGVNVGINLGRAAGAGVPGHLHVHAVPRWSGDTNFMTSVANTRVLPEALATSATRLRRAWPA